MPADPTGFANTHRGNLKRLCTLRWVALAAMVAAILAGSWVFSLELPLTPLFAIIAGTGALNLWAGWRVRRSDALAEREVFFHLLADTLALAAVFYFTGGWSNPFVSLFLLPLVIAATVLSLRQAWALALTTLAAYTGLGFFHVALPHVHHAGGDFDLHVMGMWVSFVLCSGAVAHFVARMAASLRARDRDLAEARERALRDQHVLALGTLAAGAAHQLGTPLSTMAVMLNELSLDQAGNPALGRDIHLLRSQVDACKTILSDLVAAAGQSRPENARRENLEAFLTGAVDSWRVLRPGVDVAVRLEGAQPSPVILAERSLSQTLVTLLDNAADASRDGIELLAYWTQAALHVEIRDRGQGVPEAILERAGRARLSTKQDGRGVGLLIASSALERLGGRVTLSNRPDGGASTVVELPLRGILAG